MDQPKKCPHIPYGVVTEMTPDYSIIKHRCDACDRDLTEEESEVVDRAILEDMKEMERLIQNGWG